MPAAPPPLIIFTETLSPRALAWLSAPGRARVEHCPPEDPRFDRLAPDVRGLIVRTYTRVDDRLLDRLPNLRIVARAGVGIDNIDVAACTRRGVVVVNRPDANARAVVEYVFACIFAAVRPLPAITRPLALGDWQTLRNASAAGRRQLDELTLGIYGLGRIGKRVAAAANGLGVGRVIYHDLVDVEPAARAGATPVDRTTLLGESELLTLHVDGRPGNRHLLDADAFAMLREDVTFINAARGFVVDTAAAAAFFRGRGAARGRGFVDVHEPEPVEAENPLLGLPNVVLTPHMAGRTETALDAMSDVVFDVWAVVGETGEPVAHPVR